MRRFEGQSALTGTVCVQASECSKKSSSGKEARHNWKSQTPYCRGAVVALQSPPLQQHEEGYDDPKGIHACVETVLWKALATYRYPFPNSGVGIPPSYHSASKEA